MKSKIFPYIIALSALLVSSSAIFYSVYGLSKLFAGASTAVIVMTSSLEIAKLVVASLLYTYWDKINKLLRVYLTIACLVLMLITSGGIYGFLSGAYQSTATKSELLDKHTLMLQTKQSRFQEQLSSENEAVRFYTEALSNPTMIQYIDRETEQLVTTTSARQRKLMTSQLKEVKDNVNRLNDSVSIYDMKILEKELSNESSRELGPLKYVAKSLGIEMDKVVNYFLLLIVFVFDPLAVALVISANFAFLRRNEEVEGIRSFGGWLNFFSKRHYIKKRV
tara:strand:- start:428 stop:1264 length:837 start_codon:yes stop_codon:yes gene_type:complete